QPAGGRKTVYRTRCHAPFRAPRVRRPRREWRTLPPWREQRQDKKSQRNLNHGRAAARPTGAVGAASRRPRRRDCATRPPRLAAGLTATDPRLRFASGFLAGGVGGFYRRFTLGETIDRAGIKALVKNGILTLRLPKAEHARARRIEVQAA